MLVNTGMWRSRVLVAAAASMIAGSVVWAAGDDGTSARHLVEQVTSSIVDEIESHRDAYRGDQDATHKLVERLVFPHFDFERMSRRVLGKRWKAATPEQRARFIAAFGTLLVSTYAKVVSEYSGQSLTYLEPVPRKKDDEIVIPMQVALADGQPLRVAYAMYRSGTDWKVFDVAVDGVSLVTNYRSSFRSEIAQNGIDGLIDRLEAKNSPTD